MKLSELKKVGFDAVASSLKTNWYGKKSVNFGPLGKFDGSPIALDQKQLESTLDDFIKRYGDVQTGIQYGFNNQPSVIPNCPRYKQDVYWESEKDFKYINETFGTNV